MTIRELSNFYDERFQLCFRAYFLEIGIKLREDTDVFDDITESYKKENMRTFVLEAENGIAGFIMFQPEHLKGGFFEEHAGFIRELWVAPDFRKMGYGKQLLEAAEAYFRNMDITKLILTYDENALGFYQKLGFRADAAYKAKNKMQVIVKDTEPDGGDAARVRPVLLRPVESTDAEFLCAIMNLEPILAALNEVPTQLADWSDAIRFWAEDADEEDYTICDGETPVGWLGVNNLLSEDKTAFIKMIAVLPERHGQGFGYAALQKIICGLKQREYRKIALFTDCSNRSARACYTKCGFRVTKIFTEKMSNGKTVARCKMELEQ